MDDIETVNPYDPPERQALEQKLENDTHIEHQIHNTVQQEQRLADTLQQGGDEHPNTDDRIQKLEAGEQRWAATVVQDQQAIDHWDHDHPGWDQASAAAPGDAAYGDAGQVDGGDGADSTAAGDADYPGDGSQDG